MEPEGATPVIEYVLAGIERPAATQGADPVRTVCAYGGGLSALNFAAAWGFTPDQMHVASGRWETPK